MEEKIKKPGEITTKEAFKKFCSKAFPGQVTKWRDTYCYVQAGNTDLGASLHYEYNLGQVHLHIEGNNWRPLRDFLRTKKEIIGEKMKSSKWGRYKDDCQWTIANTIETEQELQQAFLDIHKILGPYIREYELTGHYQSDTKSTQSEHEMSSCILSVKQLFEEPLCIPFYQRPYRWENKNVQQLLNDIHSSWMADKSSYRIGSVILCSEEDDKGCNRKLEIVDGQQRITTILLTLKACGENIDETGARMHYNHTDSFQHIRSNSSYIEDWLKENTTTENRKSFADYLQNKCEFVTIIVKDRSEAFQMFDSQNGRGKELEPYNLLKAYHIRAMEQNSREEKIMCDVRWEDAIQFDATPMIHDDGNIDILKQLFNEQLYRTRLWSRSREAGRFSKKQIGEFKGFTIDKNHPTMYPYQNPQLLQYLTAKFYHNILEGTIATSNRFESGDNEHIDPFANINQTIVNGRNFFDYVETYVELYKQLFVQLGTYRLAEFKRFYYSFCLDYGCTLEDAEKKRKANYAHFARGGALRTGDGYLREVYKSLILLLFDKFGEKGLNLYYKIFYRMIYLQRLTHGQVRYTTAMKLPRELNDCFAVVYQAKALSDLRVLKDKMEDCIRHTKKDDIKFDIKSERVKTFITKGR